jgi:hypothetical protein
MRCLVAVVVDGDAYRGAKYIPKISVLLVMPHALDPSGSARSRVNNRQKLAMATAMGRAMITHHKKRIPQHFHRGLQKKYRFKRRAPKTYFRKRARGIADWHLVDRQDLKKAITGFMLPPRRVGTSTGVTVVGVMQMPHGMVPNKSGSKGVTMEVMKNEITQVTAAEYGEIARDTEWEYEKELRVVLSPRQRKRLNIT